MKKEEIKYVVAFITLIISIIGLLIFNYCNNRNNDVVDRKVDYVFNRFTFGDASIKSKRLFQNAMNMLNSEDGIELEKNKKDELIKYNIKDGVYYKIVNYSLIVNTIKNVDLESFEKEYNIITYDGEHYTNQVNNSFNNSYVGSILKIAAYDNSYIYLDTIDYYCDNYDYKGVLTEEPDCKYTSKKSTIKIVEENHNLKINSINEFKKILE